MPDSTPSRNLSSRPLPGPVGYARRVLDLVKNVPRGKVVSYGDIAEMLGDGGPRQVAQVMSRWGAEVPWHRVVRADGSCAAEIAGRQLPTLRRERVPMRPDGQRVDMRRARWLP